VIAALANNPALVGAMCWALVVLLITALVGWFFCMRNLEQARDLLATCREALTEAEAELTFPISRAGASSAHATVLAALREFEAGAP
jgi:hypothetical protein